MVYIIKYYKKINFFLTIILLNLCFLYAFGLDYDKEFPQSKITSIDKIYPSVKLSKIWGSGYQPPPIEEGFRLGFGDKLLQDIPPGTDKNWQPLYLELKKDGFYFHFVICWITQNWVWGNLDDPVDPGEGGYLRRSDFLHVVEHGYIPIVAFKTLPGPNTSVDSYLQYMDKLAKLIDIGEGHEIWVMLEPGFNQNGVEYWDGFNDLMIAAIERLRSNLVNGTLVRVGLTPGEWGPYPQTYSLTKCISRVAEYCDFLAVHIMRDSAADMHKRDPWACPNPEMFHFMLNFTRYLNRTFNKPVLLGVTGISTEAWGEDAQDEFIRMVFEHRGEFMAAGAIGFCNYSYYDNDGKSMGLITRNGKKKKAWNTWRQLSYEIYTDIAKSSLGIKYPKGGDFINTDFVDIKWLHHNGKNLFFDIYFSSNAGKSWQMLAANVSTTTYKWDVRSLAPGTEYRLKILSSDGSSVESEDFAINRGYGSAFGLFDFEGGGIDMWGRIPGTDDNLIVAENSSEIASYGKRSLKCTIKTSLSSSVTKIGVFQTLDIDLRYSKSKVIKMDVYLPKELGPAPGITKACLFIHDPNWRWVESEKMWPADALGQPLHYGWNTVYFDLEHPEIKSQLTGLYPIHTVGFKLITDLEYQNTYIYLDHLVVGDEPQQSDFIPPVLTISYPSDNQTVNNYEVNIEGVAYDESGTVFCYYTVNDGPQKLILLNSDGSFSSKIVVPTGNSKITFIAKDAGNNGTEVVRYVNYFNKGGQPPQRPSVPTGVDVGATWAMYNYYSSAIDPDGDNVKYIFNWGDGSYTITDFGPSGWNGSAFHSWLKPKDYFVTVLALDLQGNVSQESLPLRVYIDNRGGGVFGDLQYVDPKENVNYPDWGEIYIADDSDYIYFLFHCYNNINTVTELDEWVYVDVDNNFYTGSMNYGGADYRFKISKLDPDRWYSYIDPVQYWSKEGSGWLFLTQIGEGSAGSEFSINRTIQQLPTGTMVNPYGGIIEFRFKKSWTQGNDRYQIGNYIRWWIDGSKDDVGSADSTIIYKNQNNVVRSIDGDVEGVNEWIGKLGANMPPVISLISPKGTNVVGEVDVQVSVLDDKGVNKVEFYINDSLKYTALSMPYNWMWDTKQYSDGNYSLKIVAYDTDNISTSTTKLVKIINNVADNPPSVKIINPQYNQVLSGEVVVEVMVSDDFGINTVKYYLTDTLKFITPQHPYSWRWDTTEISSGSYTLKVVAEDMRGQVAYDEIKVYVRNIIGDKPPSIKIISPDTTNVKGIVVVKIDVEDDKNIDKVEFWIDNKLVFFTGEEISLWGWDTTKFNTGDVKLRVIVYDNSGQTSYDERYFTIENQPIHQLNDSEKILTPNNDGYNDYIYWNINSFSKIKIFDLNGIMIKEISNNFWDGKDGNGNLVSSGFYIYSIEDNKTTTGTILVIK